MGDSLSLQAQRWLSFEFSSLSYSHLLHSPFSLDLLQKVVALTVTALDSGEPLARAGGQISSSFSQLVAGKGYTRWLASVMWCLTRCATLEISLVGGTGAMMALVAQIVWQTKTAPTTRGVNPAVACGVQGEQELVKDGNP